MSIQLKPGKLRALLPYFIFAIAVIGVYKVFTEIDFFVNGLRHFWRIVTPFFYGFLLAYIINIPFSKLQKLLGKIKFIKKIKKPLSLITSYLFFVFFVFLIMYLLIPYIFRIISFFAENIPAYYERMLHSIDYINNLDLFGFYIDMSPDVIFEVIFATLQGFFQDLSVENMSSSITTVFGGVASAVFTAVLAFISSIYILAEKEKIKGFFRRALAAFTPAKICDAVTEYTGSLNRNFRRYIFVQTIDGLILGSIVTIQLAIMRSPYFLVLGIILGIINYIPYFGSIIGTLIAVVVVTLTQGIVMGAIAAVVLIITQQIDGNVIQPKLMGGSFSLSPFLVIISITVGGATAGVFGMIAAIPIVAVLKDILEIIIAHYERKKLEGEKID